MSIYNSTISELQHFVMQPLVLRAVNLHVLILKIEYYSKCWVFTDPVTFFLKAITLVKVQQFFRAYIMEKSN